MSSDEKLTALPGQRTSGSLPSLPGIPAWASGDEEVALIPEQPSRLNERLLAARPAALLED